jgi:hypothetical protein
MDKHMASQAVAVSLISAADQEVAISFDAARASLSIGDYTARWI